jgi:hypothetical protein
MTTDAAAIQAMQDRLADAIAKVGGKRIPGDGDGDGIPYEGRGKKGGFPAAPSLQGPNAKAAIAAITTAGKSGDWRAVAGVNLLGVHPQVHAYRDAVLSHLKAGESALHEAVMGRH